MIDPIWFYLLLALATIVIAGLTVPMCRLARSIAPAVGVAFLYFWSLYGAWFVVFDLSGGESGLHYDYLFDKMFPIALDSSYLLALALYAMFVVVIQAVFIAWLRGFPRPARCNTFDRGALHVSHARILMLTCACGIASMAVMSGQLAMAMAQGASAYVFTRDADNVNPLLTLHQLLNRMCLLPAALGLAIAASGKGAKYLVGRTSPMVVAWYLVLLTGMFAFCLLLGNKNEVFFALVSAVLFYAANAPRPRVFLVSASGFIGMVAIATIDFVRGLALNVLSVGDVAGSIWDSLIGMAVSNEAFAAHFSMYGVLAFDVPLTWGTSLVGLAASVVPRFLWPGRPDDIYAHYASGVNAVSGQGYSIHHASGWYLNFGVVGVVVGAILLGLVWAKMASLQGRARGRAPFLVVLCAILPATFVGALPSLLRTGPEGYKGLVIEAMLLPAVMIWLSLNRGGHTPIVRLLSARPTVRLR